MLVQEAWGKGFVDRCGTVTYDSARYTADYIGKKILGKEGAELYEKYGIEAPFQVVSQGLGRDWVEKNKAKLQEVGSLTIHGVQVGMPRYYMGKLDPGRSKEVVMDQVKSRVRHLFIGTKGREQEILDLKKVRQQRALDMAAKQAIFRRKGI